MAAMIYLIRGAACAAPFFFSLFFMIVGIDFFCYTDGNEAACRVCPVNVFNGMDARKGCQEYGKLLERWKCGIFFHEKRYLH